ncbi:glycine-rich domain-containing protein [Ideonella sp.]|uniref:glycine-rich domain-containing protein n=1 Tax=Ideonella sp. TaxID=1929293 RepID=UPI003BB55421
MPFVLTAVLLVAAVLLWVLWRHRVRQRREAWIRQAPFPKGLFAQVQKIHPALTQRDLELVAHGLRQFFLAYLKSGHGYVSMPSQVADALWHEFILSTRQYEAFCRHAFGRFLHHAPAVSLTAQKRSNEGLRRCWRLVCQEENINPRAPSRLPLLFALDAKFGIAGGYHYIADCSGVRRDRGNGQGGGGDVYCGGDFSDASFDGGTNGLSDGDGGSWGGSDGAGDGGGGDGGGGGCGGGGD